MRLLVVAIALSALAGALGAGHAVSGYQQPPAHHGPGSVASKGSPALDGYLAPSMSHK